MAPLVNTGLLLFTFGGDGHWCIVDQVRKIWGKHKQSVVINYNTNWGKLLSRYRKEEDTECLIPFLINCDKI